MGKENRMYGLLKKMVKNADKEKPDRVFKLNRSYERLSLGVYSEPRTGLDCEYDNCRQSAFFAAFYLKKGDTEMYNKFLLDAKERFSRLP